MKTYNIDFSNGGIDVRRCDRIDMEQQEQDYIAKIMKDTCSSLIFFSLDIDEKLKSLNNKLNGDKLKIYTWEQLAKVQPSKTHKLDIDVEMCCGWIIENIKTMNDIYLSTHTFYSGDTTKEVNDILQTCGFEIELVSWEV